MGAGSKGHQFSSLLINPFDDTAIGTVAELFYCLVAIHCPVVSALITAWPAFSTEFGEGQATVLLLLGFPSQKYR